MGGQYKSIYNLGFVEFDVEQHVMQSLTQFAERATATDFDGLEKFNPRLAGHLKHEYALPADYIGPMEDFMTDKMLQYSVITNDAQIARRKIKFTTVNENSPSLWINFQRKGEVNPLHGHSGDFSFVIWVKIPYTARAEADHETVKNSNTKIGGHFVFRYPSVVDAGGIGFHYIPTDSSYEGKMIVFPSWLQHEVAPFYTSDEYRVSVAGNISLINPEEPRQ